MKVHESQLVKGKTYFLDNSETVKGIFVKSNRTEVYFEPIGKVGYIVDNNLVGFKKEDYEFIEFNENES